MTITHKSKPDFFFPLQMWPFLVYKARSKSWHSRGKPGIPQGLRGFLTVHFGSKLPTELCQGKW